MTRPKTTCRRASLLLAALSCCAAASATEATFQHYRFVPVKLRNDAAANSIQIAEFQLLHLGAAVPLATATVTNPGGSTPLAEPVTNLTDGVTTNKWLDFFRAPVVFSFTAPVTIDGYRFTTANDGTDRDPVRWLIEGSNDGSSWTLLDHRETDYATPTARGTSSGDILLPATPAPYVKTWTGSASGNWDTVSTNWDKGGAIPWLNGSTDVARFGSGAPTSVTLAEGISARVLDFTAPGYLIQGNTLTLTNVTRLTGSGNAEISSVVAGGVGVVKTGTNAITLSGNNTFTGNLITRGGSLLLTGTNAYAGNTVVTAGAALGFSGAATKGTGFLEVGTAQGNGTLNLDATGTLAFGGTPVIGTGLGSAHGAGAVRQSSGTVNYSVAGQYLTLANTTGSYGSYELSGGTMATVTDAGIRVGWNGPAVLTQTGGSLTSGRWFAIGGANAKGVATFLGGTASTIPAYRIVVGDQGGADGTINIGTAAGGTALVSTVRTATGANDGSLAIGNASNSTGVVNLNHGTLKLHGRIFRPTTATGGGAYLNLNGGTIRAGVDNVELINASLSAVRMFKGGLTIDTDGHASTFAAPVTSQAGKGIYLAGGSLPHGGLRGSGYLGAPLVTVSTDAFSTGTGASAIATVSGGEVTGVTLTCPGNGYEAGDTIYFTFTGGGTNDIAELMEYVLTEADLALNNSGGLTKTGAGSLTLTQAADFAGPVAVEAGTLVANGTLAQQPVTVAAGATLSGNLVTGGTVLVNGTFAPGVAVGTATGTSSLTFGTGSSYVAQIADWTGAAGTGHDTADVASVAVTATSGGKLTVQVDATGLVNFSESARDFVIASADAAPAGLTEDNWQVTASNFTGTGTWSLGTDGNNLVLSYEPSSSGFGTWIAGFPGLSDSTANGDPDGDGIVNLVEYVLNGQPALSSPEILPGVATGSGDMVFTFVRRAESKDDTTQVFQYGTDLENWTDLAIPAVTAGDVTITADTPSVGLETVSITVPKGTNTYLFGRLKVTQ